MMKKYDSKISKKYENLFDKAKASRWAGNYHQAEDLLLKCYNYYKRKQNQNTLKLVLQQLIDICMNTERYNEAHIYIKETMVILKQFGTKIDIANILNDLGRIYQNTGEFDLATDTFTQSLNVSKEINYKLGISIALTNLGVQFRQEGNFEKALKTLLESEIICKKESFIENSIVNLISLVYN